MCVYLGRHICTWAGVCVPGQAHMCNQEGMCIHGQICVYLGGRVYTCRYVCVYTSRHACVHGQIRVFTSRVCVCSIHGGCHSAVLSGGTHIAEPMVLAALALSLQSHVWRGGSSRHLHTRSPALLPGLGDCVQDMALTRMGSSPAPQSCSSDSGHVAHDPPGFLAAPLHLHCSTSLLKREVLQETVPVAGHSGWSSSKGSSRSSSGTLQIGTLPL